MIWIIVVIFALGLTVVVFLVMKISQQVNSQLSSMNNQLNQRLKDTSDALAVANRTVGERLDSATKVFGDVQKSLGRLEETHKQIYEISKDITSLQDLLRAPKFRGEMGETLLGKLLEDILPKENIKLQHRFKSGDIVDAAIIIGKNIISIDAKFPLENFRKFQDAVTDEERKLTNRVFLRDVKNRIDEVASKYILPDEGTFDFALMYIPAEAVYYHISKDEELSIYSKSKKVVFVSPNTFYAYLQAILYGLRGINIQRDIQKIFSELGSLRVDINKFQEDFDLVGGHLTNAAKKYNDARTKLTQLSDKIISTVERKQIESKEEVKENV
ncbi:MAG: DNA recombination protein RmuC [Candidatus Omnitrophica bacterium]|nr:DNA recombination protein RmuC [Candidatus Omnitrophota bacterium]